MNISILLSELRATVTAASKDYVGSITLATKICKSLGLYDRQKVHVRNLRTGHELWTYVICADAPIPVSTHVPSQPLPSTQPIVCLNGAAAHYVEVGDPICVSAFAYVPQACCPLPVTRLDLIHTRHALQRTTIPATAQVEMAVGKVHRPRITHTQLTDTTPPTVAIDQAWAEDAGLVDGQEVHFVNVNSGRRDIVALHLLKPGCKECQVWLPRQHGDSERSHQVGDVVILMGYTLTPHPSTSTHASIPQMRICFPFEQPE
ncbi:MAG: aspartate 1-decarboxylase [Zetaproteobacteria bacterium]|nr:aspartate 1-decarboxylase [Zetaproteobacteria bacterium]